jgi:hypothetical protein
MSGQRRIDAGTITHAKAQEVQDTVNVLGFSSKRESRLATAKVLNIL